MSTDEARDIRRPLADRLVQEAVALVRTDGPDSLSLREVQRRAGVSPAAAYRHFRDRDALLLAVAQESAGLLADHVTAVLDAVPPSADQTSTARSRLLAVCEGYLEFATQNPGLYRAVFFRGGEIEELTDPPERSRGRAGVGGYNLLVATLQDLVTATGGAAAHQWDPLVLWSCCHGLAMLRLDAALTSLPEQSFAQARDRVLRTITNAVPLEAHPHLQAGPAPASDSGR